MPSKFHWEVLAEAVKDNGWTAGAELGVKDGRVCKYLLEACPALHLIGVDTMCHKPENEGPGKERYDWDWASHRSKVRALEQAHPQRFNFMEMDTSQASLEVADGSLDFVFIDADHSYDGVSTDIAHWAPKVRRGGMIYGHDIDRGEFFAGVRRAVEEAFSDWGTNGPRWNYVWWASPEALR